MTTAHNDDVRTTGRRGWPAIASTVALLLAVGSALQVLVDVLVNLTEEKAKAPTMGVKMLKAADSLKIVVAILLIAATLVALDRAFGGADSRSATAALIIMVAGAVVAVVMLLAFLLSFGDVTTAAGKVKVAALSGQDEWATRVHLILGAIAAAAAAALANEARDRT